LQYGHAFLAGGYGPLSSSSIQNKCTTHIFANGEIKTEILESIRGRNIYIFQDIENHQPVAFNDGTLYKVLSVNDHIFNLFVAIDAAMQAGAAEINLVLPIYPYSRQHKKKEERA